MINHKITEKETNLFITGFGTTKKRTHSNNLRSNNVKVAMIVPDIPVVNTDA